MNTCAGCASQNAARTGKPLLAVVDLVTSVGGVQRVMSNLLPRLTEDFCVVAVDPYQHPEYRALLGSVGIQHLGLGTAPAQRFIGGTGRVDRFVSLASRAPWLAATGLRLRTWVQTRRPAVVYFNQLPTAWLFSRFLPQHLPVLYHSHGFSSANEVRARRRVARRFARVVAVSQSTASTLVQAGFDAAMIDVIHNAVDVEAIRRAARIATSPLPSKPPGGLAIAHVAAIAPHKRQHLSIGALAGLPNHVHLWICGSVTAGGDPKYEENLRRFAHATGVADRVHFLGWRNDVPAVLDAADIALLTSRYESFGMALAEAMALGKPCIGPAIGGIPEVIEHGVTGLVIDPELLLLAASLGELIASPAARAAMGRAGRARVERLFDPARQARRVRDALQAVVAAGAAPSRMRYSYK